MSKFKCKNPHRTVRTDQGGELRRSHAFQAVIVEEEFTLEMKGADVPAQNAYAEILNMMHCILHKADLGPEYWSFALIHSVYINNRLPHTFIKMTPYEAITGTKPDISNLRLFGYRVYIRKPGPQASQG